MPNTPLFRSFIPCFAAVVLIAWNTAVASPADEVNVFVGTAGHGHTYPGATVPFGFVQLSPDSRVETWDGCSGYHYSDTTLRGFSHTHLSGTGCGALGDILLLPITGDLQSTGSYQPIDCERFKSGFSHDRETASPGYYAVRLDRYNIFAELTATAHAGLHRYTFPKEASGHVIVDLVSGISNHVTAATLTAENSRRLSGSRTTGGWNPHRTIFYVIESSRPWTKLALEAEGKPLTDQETTAKGKKLRAAIDFAADTEPLLFRVGLSAVSVEQAAKNLETEMPTPDFDKIRADARALWNDNLSRLAIETPDESARRTFYSAVYHTMLAPTIYNDADGTYRGHDGTVHPDEGFTNYSTLSLWDTFRCEHPLLTLLTPERVNDFVRTSLAFYKQSKEHALPMWPLADHETHCMIGYHAVPMICDAYAKGFRDYDANLALQAMQDTALLSSNCPNDYDALGYVSAQTGKGHQAAARTLEYSFDDWCISKMAATLGRKDVAEQFGRRSNYFANLFDSKIGFFRGRMQSGEWRSPLNPTVENFDDFTEANAWQYAFFVPQDVPALIKLYGGHEALIRKLDACFETSTGRKSDIPDISGLIGQYAHGNEPCHHVAYLYALAGAPEKTAERVRQIMKAFYDDTPGGLCGNDDCGQMSAWYAWSAIGLYPLNPADGRYVIGSPTVTSATLRLNPKFATGRTFTISAPKASAANLYVKSATLNGKRLERPWITHVEITAGGTLELEMSAIKGS